VSTHEALEIEEINSRLIANSFKKITLPENLEPFQTTRVPPDAPTKGT
jgi:hypothetical protein